MMRRYLREMNPDVRHDLVSLLRLGALGLLWMGLIEIFQRLSAFAFKHDMPVLPWIFSGLGILIALAGLSWCLWALYRVLFRGNGRHRA